jgi:hypothetical protein
LIFATLKKSKHLKHKDKGQIKKKPIKILKTGETLENAQNKNLCRLEKARLVQS